MGKVTAAPFVKAAAVACLALGALASTAHGDETVSVCSSYGNQWVFGGASNTAGIKATTVCPGEPRSWPGTGGVAVWSDGGSSQGQSAHWQATAPSGLIIQSVYIPSMYSQGVDDGLGYGGGLYWQGGSNGVQTFDGETGWSSGFTGSPHFSWPAGGSRYFGLQLVCGSKTCASAGGVDPNAQGNYLGVGLIEFRARETSPPWIGASGSLWSSTGWIRGDVTLQLAGDSPSGLCTMGATLGGQQIPGASYTAAHNPAVWHQCNGQPGPITVNTANPTYGNGPVTLALGGIDAAGIGASNGRTVQIDNVQPHVSLSGPTDAPSSAGTQFVAATATAGPSGVQGMTCSVDGAPALYYSGASAQVPVAGTGQHSLRCAAENNAVDGAGNHGWSDWATWALNIRQPTVSGIGFSRLVDAMRCRRARKAVRVPARWVSVRRHHRLVRIKRPAHTKIVNVTHCRPRIVHRRVAVWATVSRHGKKVRVIRKKTVRIVVLPHVVTKSSKRVGHGKRTTVNGWLGIPDGTALGGQTVRVLAAPDDGLGHWTQAALATTASNGSWTATLPAGPSRLVEAAYDGTAALEPSTSGQVNVIVPSKVQLISVSPPRVAWSGPSHPGTVRIVGQLKGGHLPAGGALVRLRIGQGATYTTYGVQEHVTGRGRFSTTYTFGDGVPSVHRAFWFQLASLPMGDYPYAPSDSRRVTVIVGGHPATPAPRHHHKHSRHARHSKR